MTLPVTPDQIAAIHSRLIPHIRRTPVMKVPASDLGLPDELAPVALKLEHLQHTGSFKARGAMTHLLTRDIPKAGVVAASGGNHGAAVAWAAGRMGTTANIFVPEISAPAKRARIESYGATLHVGGAVYADALTASVRFADETGAKEVHAYDAVETLTGQGTVALEFLEDAPVDTLLVATGGGGLIGGIAAYVQDRVRVVSVEPEAAPTLHDALRAGHPVDVAASGLAADSLGARRVGDLAFEIATAHVDATLLLPDAAIRAAWEFLWDRLRLAVEPGGAAALAALTSGAYRPVSGERVGVVICGANTGIVQFPD